jgi:hypothetical protein
VIDTMKQAAVPAAEILAGYDLTVAVFVSQVSSFPRGRKMIRSTSQLRKNDSGF